MILATRFTFIVERSWKNMKFHPKLTWPPATYVVISRNHSNWPSLNSSQNLRVGWTDSHWKRQVLMFCLLGKKLNKILWGVVASTHPPPPPPFVRPRVKRKQYVFSLFLPDHFLWRHRPPAAPQPIKYIPCFREDQKLSTEWKIVSK